MDFAKMPKEAQKRKEPYQMKKRAELNGTKSPNKCQEEHKKNAKRALLNEERALLNGTKSPTKCQRR